ncbi:MAG: rubrerythrin family protein [Pseudomonadota bacterium]
MTEGVRGTKTEKNLMVAFAGESQARNRYTYSASAARKAGYEQIAAIFLETADNEKEHAKRFLKFLKETGGEVSIEASYPAHFSDDTAANLRAAAGGEHEEWSRLYPGFAEVAETEGFSAVATAFREIARVEAEHERRYLALLANLERGEVFRKERPAKWHCRNCGYVAEGEEAPKTCPACLHPRDYFELLAENY